MDRLQKFSSFESHAWFGKQFKKLAKKEIELALGFIQANRHLDKGEFEQAVNRMFIDKEKPKNYALISELLACSNS